MSDLLFAGKLAAKVSSVMNYGSKKDDGESETAPLKDENGGARRRVGPGSVSDAAGRKSVSSDGRKSLSSVVPTGDEEKPDKRKSLYDQNENSSKNSKRKKHEKRGTFM